MRKSISSKKLTALLLTIIMLFSVFSTSAIFATEDLLDYEATETESSENNNSEEADKQDEEDSYNYNEKPDYGYSEEDFENKNQEQDNTVYIDIAAFNALVADNTTGRIIGLHAGLMISTDNGATFLQGNPNMVFAPGAVVWVNPIDLNLIFPPLPWVPGSIHVAGDRVIHNGNLWTALWWTDSAPGEDTAWQNNGTWTLPAPPSVPVQTITFEAWSQAQIDEFFRSSRAALAQNRKIVGYFPSWSIYAGHDYFRANMVDLDLLTHVLYSFILIEPVTNDWNGYWTIAIDDKGAFGIPDETNWINPDAPFPALRDMINARDDTFFKFSVGGWTNSELGQFTYATRTQSRIDALSRDLVDFMLEHGFDGIDIDWEFPVNNTDKAQFIAFIRTLRRMMDEEAINNRRYFQLGIATTPNPELVQYISPLVIANYVDSVNFMAYDYNGAWQTTTGHNTPLFDYTGSIHSNFNIHDAVTSYLEQGVPRHKLLIGTAFYGRSWNNVRDEGIVPGLPGLASQGTMPLGGSAGHPVYGTWGYGTMPFYMVEERYATGGYVRFWDYEAHVPFLFNENTGRFITFDDAESISIKVDYIIDGGFGGTLIWALSGDTRADRGTSAAHLLGRELRRLLNEPFTAGERPQWPTLTLENTLDGYSINGENVTTLDVMHRVPVNVNIDTSGYEFVRWEVVQGSLENVDLTDAELNFRMPNENITLRALWENRTNEVYRTLVLENVFNGFSINGQAIRSATFAVGSSVTINLGNRLGHTFVRAETINLGTQVRTVLTQSSFFSFTMPNYDVAIEAIWDQIIFRGIGLQDVHTGFSINGVEILSLVFPVGTTVPINLGTRQDHTFVRAEVRPLTQDTTTVISYSPTFLFTVRSYDVEIRAIWQHTPPDPGPEPDPEPSFSFDGKMLHLRPYTVQNLAMYSNQSNNIVFSNQNNNVERQLWHFVYDEASSTYKILNGTGRTGFLSDNNGTLAFNIVAGASSHWRVNHRYEDGFEIINADTNRAIARPLQATVLDGTPVVLSPNLSDVSFATHWIIDIIRDSPELPSSDRYHGRIIQLVSALNGTSVVDNASTRTVLWQNNNASNQRWTAQYSVLGGGYILRNRYDGRFLTNVGGSAVESRSQISASSVWYFVYAPTPTGATQYNIVNAHTGLVLNVNGSGNGTWVGANAANGSNNQRWSILEREVYDIPLSGIYDGHTVTITTRLSGTAVIQSDPNNRTFVSWYTTDTSRHRWVLEYIGFGTYHIRNEVTGYFLTDVGNGAVHSVANAQHASQWHIVPNIVTRAFFPSLEYQIINARFGSFLDVTGGNFFNGAWVGTWRPTGNANQAWNINISR